MIALTGPVFSGSLQRPNQATGKFRGDFFVEAVKTDYRLQSNTLLDVCIRTLSFDVRSLRRAGV
jgi:hypothetical protein